MEEAKVLTEQEQEGYRAKVIQLSTPKPVTGKMRKVCDWKCERSDFPWLLFGCRSVSNQCFVDILNKIKKRRRKRAFGVWASGVLGVALCGLVAAGACLEAEFWGGFGHRRF